MNQVYFQADGVGNDPRQIEVDVLAKFPNLERLSLRGINPYSPRVAFSKQGILNLTPLQNLKELVCLSSQRIGCI